MSPEKRPRGRPKSAFKESSAGGLQSLDRALMLLSAVARRQSATLSDLARETDIPTATTHRILSTLQAQRYVAFDEERQEWRVGIEAYRTGLSFLARTSVAEVGRPVMRRLMADTGETANLAVPDGAEVVFIGQVETPNPIRAFFPPGTRTSMHASGTGKAILAALRPDRLARVMGRIVFDAYTPGTLASEAALRADLSETARRGWSLDLEERHPGMSCIGAAIRDEQGDPCAGISVSGPTARFSPDRVPGLGRAVREAAREITELSGGRWA
ncbi:IclR family transcriptional regulator [Sagittula stellata]|uniref:Transcription regulator n=1 Tax=Sagittula stellata (strain ATCC 700073 / DSM 11524 / E-37) TaxID=388399 RepID=A3KB72_SAGS3|nr:IclR family transcriptional regulator [Sagittula stellata]EBA05578.1 transcription regulator [Sagittula stellata E-37]